MGRRMVIGVGALLGCAGAPAEPVEEDWVVELASADPMLGGGASFARLLVFSPRHVWTGSAAARDAFLRRHAEEHDRVAQALVRETVSEELARVVLEFLCTDAGNALVRAEELTLTLFHHQQDDFPTRTVARFGDAGRVGDSQQVRIAELSVSVASGGGGSVSPSYLALEIAAQQVSPENAQAIAAFTSSEDGRLWVAARSAAFERSQRRFEAFLASASEAEHFAWRDMDLEDLILPDAEYAVPEPAEREPAQGGR